MTATQLIGDTERVKWHDKALWAVRSKRDTASAGIPEWEELRELAAQIKQHTLSKLPDYLQQFEEQAAKMGAVVHWASNAEEHNVIVHRILEENKVRYVVKSKSMLTEECGLNPYLEKRNIEITDTDLGERIVQLAEEPPSHIVLPAIHMKKEDIGELFHTHLGTPKGLNDAKQLTEAARQDLRKKFLQADAGITGVNFAIAETGGLVVCTNEGNADLGTALPPIHIACMGMEKLLPRAKDLSVFLRLLARSATGQPITTYSSHFHGPRTNNQLHIVIVDNGRYRLFESKEFSRALSCIRCGACMNTCPVYRRTGGHSYHATIPGPIGSILSPNQDGEAYASLPYRSSLCGSCTDVCPVKINLHEQLLLWRREMVKRRRGPGNVGVVVKLVAWGMKSEKLFAFGGYVARTIMRLTPSFILNSGLHPWGKQRDLPEIPKESFRKMYQKRNKQ